MEVESRWAGLTHKPFAAQLREEQVSKPQYEWRPVKLGKAVTRSRDFIMQTLHPRQGLRMLVSEQWGRGDRERFKHFVMKRFSTCNA